MFDTHCHLNFEVFEGKIEEVLREAEKVGVRYFMIPGSDLKNSKKAVEIAQKYKNVYAGVGIHPHHIYKIQSPKSKAQNENPKSKIKKLLEELESLLKNEKVAAVGEIGLDKHNYQKTKYEQYKINEEFLNFQKELFVEQLNLAKQYQKSVIIHNREAKNDTLAILTENWDSFFAGRMVFHCCEPDEDLLNFALKRQIFIGLDGDITYNKKKQNFIKKIPLESIVLETDSPFLIPEPLKSQEKGKDALQCVSTAANTPVNIPLIQNFIAELLNKNQEEIREIFFKNSKELFRI